MLTENKTILRSQQKFKSKTHNAFTEEVNKIASSGNDDKRLQPSDGITSYPYDVSAGKVWKTELLQYLT